MLRCYFIERFSFKVAICIELTEFIEIIGFIDVVFDLIEPIRYCPI